MQSEPLIFGKFINLLRKRSMKLVLFLIGKTGEKYIHEGSLIVSKLKASQHLSLFNENGKRFSSRQFALFLQKKTALHVKELVFVIDGPYGFSDEIYNLADSKISLSKMNFSYQLARLLCLEQLYRAFTIFRGESYHHD